MTSKEAITKLNVLSSYDTTTAKREEYKECINAILKDLKRLEKLKKAIGILRKKGHMINNAIYALYLNQPPKTIYMYQQDISFNTEESDFIKEVLENDK